MPVRFYFLVSALLLPVTILGQLTAPGMNSVRYTTYPSSPGVKDPIFIYCNSTGTQKGTINAVSPGGTGPFNFSWYRWNQASENFSIFIKTDAAVMNSTINNLEEGGYRVSITNGSGFSTNLVAWIFLDRPSATAELLNRTCDYVALKGVVSADVFEYNDPDEGEEIHLPNRVRFLWSSDPASSIPFPDLELSPQTFNPPLVDVTYRLQVTDSFTCSNESSFFYESIHVKADFSVEPPAGEAPLEVTFTDKSIRADTYKWEFGDDSVSFLSNPEPHTYYIPGEYSAKLTVESGLHCIDSLRFDGIVVEPSVLEIPNVFTPDGDGTNDYFMVNKSSLKYISMEVFSRSGIKVYSFYGEGPILKEWNGWDGNVNDSSIKASPGVYFYVIKALGW
ncbi:MAG: gliding motility-associated C-terminal domain-containing protein, partial [Bacteroidales bacterium]